METNDPLVSLLIPRANMARGMLHAARATMGSLPMVARALLKRARKPIKIIVDQRATTGSTDCETMIRLPRVPLPRNENDVEAALSLAAMMYGLIHHEVGHCNHSDAEPMRQARPGLEQTLLNIIEDVRMELAHIRDMPNARAYLDALNLVMHRQGRWAGETDPSQPVLAFLNYVMMHLNAVYRLDPSAKAVLAQNGASLETAFSPAMRQSLDALLTRLPSLQDSHDSLRLTKDVVSLLQQEQQAAQEQQKKDSDTAEQSDDGVGDPEPQSTGDAPQDSDAGKDDGSSDEDSDQTEQGSGASASDGAEQSEEGEGDANSQDTGDDSQDGDAGKDGDASGKDSDSAEQGSGAASSDDSEQSEDGDGDSASQNTGGQSQDQASASNAGSDSNSASQPTNTGGDSQDASNADSDASNGQGSPQGNANPGQSSLADNIGQVLSHGDTTGDKHASAHELLEEVVEAVKQALSMLETLDVEEAIKELDEAQNLGRAGCESGDLYLGANHDLGVSHSASLAIRRKLLTELDARTNAEVSVGRRGRSLSSRHLPRVMTGDGRVFKNKVEGDQPDTAVMLVQDVSSSMCGRPVELASQALYAASLALSGIEGIDVAAMAFPGNGKVIGFGDNPRANQQRFMLQAHGGTPMAEAVRAATQALLDQRNSRRLMIVLTDGAPYSFQETLAVIAAAESAGIEIYGVGICSDVVQHLFSKWIAIHDVNELPTRLVNLVRDEVMLSLAA